MAEAELGDVLINGLPYRIMVSSYRMNDIVDFAPRAATPGGSILMSQLGLYQPLYQTDWRHGLGHFWYDDAQGYMRTDGNIDTRQSGLAMLMTAATPVTQSGANNLTGVFGGWVVWNGNLYAWGSNGVWQYSGVAYNAGWVQIDTGTIQMALATGPFLYWCAAGSRLQKYNGAVNNGTGNTLSMTIATPAVFTLTAHGLAAGNAVRFATTGALPTGLTAGTVYYVIATNLTVNTFRVSATRAGAAVATSGSQSGTQTLVAATDAGTSLSLDFAWALMSGGFFWFGDANASRIHFDNNDNGLTGLEGGATDPALIYAGAGGYTTLGALNYFGHMYVFRVDGIFLLDTTAQTVSKVLDFSNQASSTNFRSFAVHNGFMVFPLRDRLFQWNGIRLADITPPQVTDQFPYVMYGRYTNFVVVGRFLLCTARDSSLPYNEDLLCFDGVGWYKLARLVSLATTAFVAAMSYDVINNRLWVQVNDTVPSVSAFQFNDLSEFPYPSFPTSGTHSLVTSRLDMGFRRVTKSVPSIIVRGANCSASHYLKLWYALDGGSWTAWGGNDGVTNIIQTSGNVELKDPLGTGSSTIEFTYILLRFDFITSDSANTPVLEEWTLRFLMRPNVAYGHSMQIISAGASNFGGYVDGRSPDQLIADLQTARNSKSPILFVDLFGVTHTVYVSSLQESAQERHLRSRGESTAEPNIEGVVQINLVELS